MLDMIRGTASFKASSENLYRFINSIRENNFVCTDQHCKNGVFFGRIYRRDMERLEELAKQTDTEIEYIEKKGLSFKLFSYRMRFGIIIGIAAAMCFIFYISNIVVSIDITGNSSVSDEQIISALSDIGIYKGKMIADIDFSRCEKRLKLSIPEIAWAGIRHTGSRIVVDVTEMTAPPDMLLENVPCNITSSQDAQITYMEVYSGKAVKKTGDTVKKGDVIISGIVQDDKGHTLKNHAMGKVIGLYRDRLVIEQPFEEEGQVYTGEELTQKYLEFFGFRIPLFFKKADFESYDYSESTSPFMVFGAELPIGIVHSTYTPFVSDTVKCTPEEADKLLEQKTALHEKNFYDGNGIKVVERNISKKVYEDRAVYEIGYVLEGDIGEEYEIYVRK